jgi:hypothetical protein
MAGTSVFFDVGNIFDLVLTFFGLDFKEERSRTKSTYFTLPLPGSYERQGSLKLAKETVGDV